jgi:hypothetical protein
VHKCPTRAGDHAVTIVFSILSVPINVWSHAHRSEIMSAVSTALRVPEHVIHAEAPQDGDVNDQEWELPMRIRISRSLFLDSPHDVAERIVEMATHAAFPSVLAYSLNGEMKDDMKWRWLTGDYTLSVKSAEVKRLAQTKEQNNLKANPAKVADPGSASQVVKKRKKNEAAQAARIQAIKDSPGYFSINYGAFGTPLSWDKFTYLKVLCVLLIQGLVVSIFFVLKRIQSIRQAQERDPTPAFDAYKGVAPKKKWSKVGSIVDRRGRHRPASP